MLFLFCRDEGMREEYSFMRLVADTTMVRMCAPEQGGGRSARARADALVGQQAVVVTRSLDVAYTAHRLLDKCTSIARVRRTGRQFTC